ncbi:MAG: hypothetical protein RLZZ563_628 [Pseudomonadota bacterium]|jgi:hypothetical protein
MTDAANLSAKADLCLSAPSPAAVLAAPVLAKHLGISRQAALRRLGSAPCVLATCLDPQPAQRLLALMSALGLRVRLVQSNSAARRVDVSVQLSVWSDAKRLSKRIADVMDRDPHDIAIALAQPGGLILQDLDGDDANSLCAQLRRTRGLVILRSDPETAVYDVFANRPLSDAEGHRLRSCLRLIGSTPDPVTGAVAAGLGRSLRDHVLSRLPDLGLFALDRCFQRYDLMLSDVSGWLTKDLADFLAGRTAKPRSRFEVISPETPLPLDLGLTQQVARQFRGDYAAIGLNTRLVLSGRARNS